MPKNKKGKQKQDEPAIKNNQTQPSIGEQINVPGRYFYLYFYPFSADLVHSI